MTGAPYKHKRQRATEKPVEGLAVRRALYLRVSTEDQAERGTIEAQEHVLRAATEATNRARELQGLTPVVIVGVYRDDGVSGAIPMADRPDGARLLADARSGAMDHIQTYRLDRLGRSLRVLMEAHDALETAGVAIISATEPFDTSTPFGRAMFQFLGLMAELERSTIAERMDGGRMRSVRAGKWTNGPIPFGYDLDAERRLTPDERIVPSLGITHAELARQMFSRVADEGESASGLVRWLNAMGVPTARRYSGGRERLVSPLWGVPRVTDMLHSPIYKGVYRFHGSDVVEQACPALVDADVWGRVQTALEDNRRKPPASGKTTYLLRGFIRCGNCGGAFTGTPAGVGQYRRPYYHCANSSGNKFVQGDPCPSIMLRADWLEATVWDLCVAEAGRDDTVEDIQALYQSHQGATVERDTARDTLLARLGDLEGEKDKVVRLYRKSLLSEAEAEAQIQEIGESIAAVRAELGRLDAMRALDDAKDARLAQAAMGMAQVRALLTEALDAAPVEDRRLLIRAVVDSIVVTTDTTTAKGKRKRAEVRIRTYLGGVTDLEAGHRGVVRVSSTTSTHSVGHLDNIVLIHELLIA